MLKKLKAQSNNRGFSLVELIIVIAIMAVLIGVLAPQYIKYVEKSKESADLANIEQLKKAVQVAAADDSYKIPFAIVIIDDTGITPTLKVGESATDKRLMANALAEYMPDYASIKLKSKKYSAANAGNGIEIFLDVKSDGTYTVTVTPQVPLP